MDHEVNIKVALSEKGSSVVSYLTVKVARLDNRAIVLSCSLRQFVVLLCRFTRHIKQFGRRVRFASSHMPEPASQLAHDGNNRLFFSFGCLLVFVPLFRCWTGLSQAQRRKVEILPGFAASSFGDLEPHRVAVTTNT